MNKIKVNVKGKNIERFLKRLATNNIELFKINYLKYNEVNIIIKEKDYEKLMELKTIYDVNMVDIYGIIKIKKQINLYKHIIISVLISLFILIFLSNIIFNIEVIHTDKKVRDLLINELEEYGLKKYKFKKSFEDIQNIKKQILEKYKDKIEWLEIEESGTTYIIRIEQRLIPENNISNKNQNIIAKKSAIIKSIIAKNGQVIKELNSYVLKGEVIISGNIYFNNIIKDTVKAEGNVYGEVWYNVTVEYPYIYSEMKETGNHKDIYVLKIFDKKIEFTTKKFKEKRVLETKILSHDLLPFSLVKEKQFEINTDSYVLTIEQAIKKAIETGVNKMNDRLKTDEKIIEYKVLKTNLKDDKVILNMFFTVFENITGYEVIDEINDTN